MPELHELNLDVVIIPRVGTASRRSIELQAEAESFLQRMRRR